MENLIASAKAAPKWLQGVSGALVGIGLALMVWGFMSGDGDAGESQARELAGRANQVAQEIQEHFARQRAAVEAAAAAASGAESAPAVAGASNAWLLPNNIARLKPEPPPGPDFSVIAAAIRAREGQTAGPIMGAGVSWATPVDETSLLAAVFPRQAVDASIENAGGDAWIALLRDGQSGEQALVERGTRLDGVLVQRVPIAGTPAVVAYQVPDAAGGGGGSGLLLIVLGLVSLAAGLAALLFGPRAVAAAPSETIEEAPTEATDAPTSLAESLGAGEDVDEDLVAAMGLAAAPEAGAQDIDLSMFRAYDIRGIVDEGLTVHSARAIGLAIGSEARARDQKQIVVGRDGRHSGPDLSRALIDGLVRTGMDVIDIGAVPTGVLYYATHKLNTGSGVMITGSHNPPEYNGFKVMLGGNTLAAEEITDLGRRVVEGDFVKGRGGVQEVDLLDDYVDQIASDIQVEEPLKVVLDCGNGIAGVIAPQVIEEIGCDVETLYCDVDGDFPNHHPDPSVPGNLQDLMAAVAEHEADIGLAFDGDGDRLGVVTRDGRMIFPDRLLMLFARDVLMRNPGATIIYDVKCTGQLPKVVLREGGSPMMWKTGHSLIKSKMKETGALLAGEMSGHFFFKERWYGFDDGIYAAARLLEILASSVDGVQETLDALPDTVSTPEIKIDMAEGEHYAFIEEFSKKADFPEARVTRIDGVRADYEDGWGLVRCSNTTPCLVLRFDAETPEALERIQIAFKEQIARVRDDIQMPITAPY